MIHIQGVKVWEEGPPSLQFAAVYLDVCPVFDGETQDWIHWTPVWRDDWCLNRTHQNLCRNAKKNLISRILGSDLCTNLLDAEVERVPDRFQGAAIGTGNAVSALRSYGSLCLDDLSDVCVVTSLLIRIAQQMSAGSGSMVFHPQVAFTSLDQGPHPQ